MEGNAAGALLAAQFRAAAGLLEMVTSDLTPESAAFVPPGIANPAGTTWAHVLLSVDGLVNGMLKGGTPLFASTFAGKTGMSGLPPLLGPEMGDVSRYHEGFHAWAVGATLDLAALRAYGAAVCESAAEWLSTCTGADLEKPLDLSFLGLGMQTAGFIVHNAVLAHVASHAGEIAAIKGLQGLKGYPF
jgi:hypothetical protein